MNFNELIELICNCSMLNVLLKKMLSSLAIAKYPSCYWCEFLLILVDLEDHQWLEVYVLRFGNDFVGIAFKS